MIFVALQKYRAYNNKKYFHKEEIFVKKIAALIILLLIIFSADLLCAAAFSQADLTGKWRVNILEKRAGEAKWVRAYASVNTAGNVACLSYADSQGGNSCPVEPLDWNLTISSRGVITQTGADAASQSHATMNAGKNLIVETGTAGSRYQLAVWQKVVTGTTYLAGDVRNKSWVMHELTAGTTKNFWKHGKGATDATGKITISSETDPWGTDFPGATGITMTLYASGEVTLTGEGMETYQGFLSNDKKTIVGTYTDDSGESDIRSRLMIIQFTGKVYTAGPIPNGLRGNHMLSCGAANFWVHQTSITDSGSTFFRDWVSSIIGANPPASALHLSLDTTGKITMTEDNTFHGQASHDGTFTVSTMTNNKDTGIYGLQISMPGNYQSIPKKDFNSDGVSDIIWKRPDNKHVLWFMNKAGSAKNTKLLAAIATWNFASSGDFNGDGVSDIIWKKPDNTHECWIMNKTGGAITKKAFTALSTWSIFAIADFNNDGVSDIIWKRPNGKHVLWFMNKAGSAASTKELTALATWKLTAGGDFNGDGISDIIWKRPDNKHVLWFMNKTGGTASTKELTALTTWNVIATGDFNGDGVSDIIWKRPDNKHVLWFMKKTGGPKTTKALAALTTWVFTATGDFNADGIFDIIWKKPDDKYLLCFLNEDGTFAVKKNLAALATWNLVKD